MNKPCNDLFEWMQMLKTRIDSNNEYISSFDNADKTDKDVKRKIDSALDDNKMCKCYYNSREYQKYIIV